MKKKRNGLSLAAKDSLAGLSFIMPFILGVVLIFVPNMIKAVSFSLSEIIFDPSGAGYSLEFLGLSQYKEALFVNADFNKNMVESIIGMLTNVPLIIIFSFFMSTLLSTEFRGKAIVQTIVFLPIIISSGVLISLNSVEVSDGIMTSAVTNEAVSTIDAIGFLTSLGIPSVFVSSISAIMSKIYQVIMASGVQILVFIAALNTISPSIYEAAKMEGATSWEEFWKITFPMVSPYILTNVVYSIVDSLSAESSPGLSLILKISQSGSVDIALGSAMSIMFFGVELVFLAVMVFIISRIVFYYD